MSVEKIKFSLKSDKNNGHATRKPMYMYGNVSLTFLRMRKIQIGVVGKIKIHFYFQYTER
jgi:transposase-like protein